ncbi:MAG: hypothetical protein ABIJ12_07910, partial [bacterium]
DIKYYGFLKSGKVRPFVEIGYGVALEGANYRNELSNQLGFEIGVGTAFQIHNHYGIALELGSTSLRLRDNYTNNDSKMFVKAGLLFNRL